MYYVLHCLPSILGRHQNLNTKFDTRFLDIARSVFSLLPEKFLYKSRVGFNMFKNSGIKLACNLFANLFAVAHYFWPWAMVDFEFYLNFSINVGFNGNDQ